MAPTCHLHVTYLGVDIDYDVLSEQADYAFVQMKAVSTELDIRSEAC